MNNINLSEFLNTTVLKNNVDWVTPLLKTAYSKNITTDEWNRLVHQIVDIISKNSATYTGFESVDACIGALIENFNLDLDTFKNLIQQDLDTKIQDLDSIKLDKIESPHNQFVYASLAKVPTAVGLANAATGNTVPLRGANKTFSVGKPTGIYDVANKEYVDDTVATVQLELHGVKETQSLLTDRVSDVESLAKGEVRCAVFHSYKELIETLNKAGKEDYIVGQHLLVRTLNVPDVWVYSVVDSYFQHEYTTDKAFVEMLNGRIPHVGYYMLSALETQKVDLADYVKKDRYGSSTQAGLVKCNTSYGININPSNGLLRLVNPDKQQIDSRKSYMPLTLSMLDYALKVGLTTNTKTLSDDEKLAACDWLGADRSYEYERFVETDEWVTILNRTNPENPEGSNLDINRVMFEGWIHDTLMGSDEAHRFCFDITKMIQGTMPTYEFYSGIYFSKNTSYNRAVAYTIKLDVRNADGIGRVYEGMISTVIVGYTDEKIKYSGKGYVSNPSFRTILTNNITIL